jgi:hypothetical protein
MLASAPFMSILIGFQVPCLAVMLAGGARREHDEICFLLCLSANDEDAKNQQVCGSHIDCEKRIH